MAKKENNVISDILDEIDKEKSIKNHPMVKGDYDYDYEFKLHYLYGVALVMNVDNEIHPLERNFLIRLIKTFKIQLNILDELINFSKNPSKKEMEDIIENIQTSSSREIFLTDCFIMACKDKKILPSENKMLMQLKKLLNTSRGFSFTILKSLQDQISTDRIAPSTVYRKVLKKNN